ncbi:hypothetical protein [uncultured Ilyobacter sp.]|uniref:hypothetical protein n=1 Tax=uncultured Ilyobacter sp. TaxID=544433 RepID=UPI0029C87B51|nr:hypothetical protein [uncultured Ilyobacter sp.]
MFDKILEAMEMEKEIYFLPKKEYFYDMEREEIMERLKGVLQKGARIILSKNRCLYTLEGKFLLLTLIDPKLCFTNTGIKDEKGEPFSEDEIIDKSDGLIEGLTKDKAEGLLESLLEECYKVKL